MNIQNTHFLEILQCPDFDNLGGLSQHQDIPKIHEASHMIMEHFVSQELPEWLRMVDLAWEFFDKSCKSSPSRPWHMCTVK